MLYGVPISGVMWECRRCVLRCIRAVISDGLIAQPPAQRNFVSQARLSPWSSYRRYASTANPTRQDHITIADDPQNNGRIQKRGGEMHVENERVHERALRTELQYLKDPVKLAEHVHYTLRCNKPLKAVELCRLASKSMSCVVSWNHVVDYYMGQGRQSEAIKIYNEMKKRAQFPDSYTYILLLRGFPQTRTHHGRSEVKHEMVGRALAIYNSMSSPTSRVKPSIRHTNAMLRICTLGRDMDTLWTVASNIPEHGYGSADYITYTILLSAIRHGVLEELSGQPNEGQVAASRQKAVNEGRRIWAEIITKWREGEILIDDELVAQMGNLLLTSKRLEDWDDVFNLVKQTTNVERKLPHLGSPERHTEHIPVEKDAQEDATPVEDSDGWVSLPASNIFKPVEAIASGGESSKGPISLTWVKPGNAILSKVIAACTHLRSVKAAYDYWDAFILEHGVKPDRANFHALLGLLAMNRNDTKAAAVLRDVAAMKIELRNQTFRMAMRTCSRNWKSPRVMESATSIIDVMQEHLSDPDVHTLGSFLSLALQTDDGAKIVAAIDRLDPMVHNLRSRITFGSEERTYHSERNLTEAEEIVTLLQSLIGAIDTLTNRGLVPAQDLNTWRARRYDLDKFIGRALEKVKNLRAEVSKKAEKSGRKLTPEERFDDRGMQRSRDQRPRHLRELEKFRHRGERSTVAAKHFRLKDFADSPAELDAR